MPGLKLNHVSKRGHRSFVTFMGIRGTFSTNITPCIEWWLMGDGTSYRNWQLTWSHNNLWSYSGDSQYFNAQHFWSGRNIQHLKSLGIGAVNFTGKISEWINTLRSKQNGWYLASDIWNAFSPMDRVLFQSKSHWGVSRLVQATCPQNHLLFCTSLIHIRNITKFNKGSLKCHKASCSGNANCLFINV